MTIVVEVEDYLLGSRKVSLVMCEDSPALVTVVNSSRVVSDIRRDLGRLTGDSPRLASSSRVFILGLKTESIMLIVIKSAQPGDVPPARINFTEDRRVKQCRYVLVDVKYTHPLHCQYNTETYNSITEFLSTEDSFK